jgi:hypothetical protein
MLTLLVQQPAQLPVFSLSYPRDFSRLPDMHEAILQQYHHPASEFS